jgi:hypothetical protein
LKEAVTFTESSASLKKANASPKKATSPCEVLINGTWGSQGKPGIRPPDEKGNQMRYVLTHFLSPLGIERYSFIVAVTATTLAFAFAALVVLGG